MGLGVVLLHLPHRPLYMSLSPGSVQLEWQEGFGQWVGMGGRVGRLGWDTRTRSVMGSKLAL